MSVRTESGPVLYEGKVDECAGFLFGGGSGGKEVSGQGVESGRRETWTSGTSNEVREGRGPSRFAGGDKKERSQGWFCPLDPS